MLSGEMKVLRVGPAPLTLVSLGRWTNIAAADGDMSRDLAEVRLRPWAFVCQSALHEIFALMRVFFAQKTEDQLTDFVLGQLSATCMMTSESALLLIQSARVWDAEMLVRSSLEGTYKFAFMCSRDDSERLGRVKEYYVDLPNINRLKRHERAVAMLAAVENSDADEWRPFRDLTLSEEEVANLRQNYPRKTRQAMEQKWAFIPIVQAISQSGLPGAEHVVHMSHGYGMSSHLLHQDGDGVAMVWERQRRSFERENAINMCHGAREISDLLHMAVYRVLTAYYLKEIDPDPVYAVYEKYSHLQQELAEAYTGWHAIEYADNSQ